MFHLSYTMGRSHDNPVIIKVTEVFWQVISVITE